MRSNGPSKSVDRLLTICRIFVMDRYAWVFEPELPTPTCIPSVESRSWSCNPGAIPDLYSWWVSVWLFKHLIGDCFPQSPLNLVTTTASALWFYHRHLCRCACHCTHYHISFHVCYCEPLSLCYSAGHCSLRSSFSTPNPGPVVPTNLKPFFIRILDWDHL